MKKVRVGVVGLGWVSQMFHLPHLLKNQDVSLVAACDKDKARLKHLGDKFAIPNVTTDPSKLVERDDVDAVLVCTPTDAHRGVTLAALGAGKHVFVEKPMALDSAEATDMNDAAEKAGKVLMVGMNNRFRPDIMILKSFIEKGELGKTFFGKGGWLKSLSNNNPWMTRKEKSGGGVVLDLGIPMLDLMLWLLGMPKVTRVSAQIHSHKTKTVEDTCIATIYTKTGAMFTFEVSWSLVSSEDYFYANIFGTEGSAFIHPLKIYKQLHGNLVNLTPASADSATMTHRKGYENELKHFLRSINDQHPVISTAAEAIERMKVIEAIYASSAKGKEIQLK